MMMLTRIDHEGLSKLRESMTRIRAATSSDAPKTLTGSNSNVDKAVRRALYRFAKSLPDNIEILPNFFIFPNAGKATPWNPFPKKTSVPLVHVQRSYKGEVMVEVNADHPLYLAVSDNPSAIPMLVVAVAQQVATQLHASGDLADPLQSIMAAAVDAVLDRD